MRFNTVIIITLLAMSAAVPVATGQSEVPFTISNRATIGGATQIVSEADGTTIWNLLIHAGDTDPEAEKELTFELLMEADTPVYAIFEIMDVDGVITALDAPPVLPGRIVESLDDLVPVSSDQLEVGVITSETFLTINIFLFKDPDHSLLYENGHIVTMLYGTLNCYQQEAQCFQRHQGNYGDPADAKIPWGWKKDLPEKAGWSYNGLQYVMSQNVARHFQDLPPLPAPGPELVVVSNPGPLEFGEVITVTIQGEFLAATAILYHVDNNATVSLVAVDQVDPIDRSIDFRTPDGPTNDYPAGKYQLHLNFLSVDGRQAQQKFEYTLT